MRQTTKDIHHRLIELGRALGFEARREVSDSLLRLRLDDAYQPRIDLLWSLPLDAPKREAIGWVLGLKLPDVSHLPIVGIEVEATTPTTKTMSADAANLAAAGVPLGLLVVSEAGERNIYRRAARAIRSVRRSFGDVRLLPVEASWLPELISHSWPVGLTKAPVPKHGAPAGGETREWSATTRKRLREMGRRAGFVVAEPFVPPVLGAAFDQVRRLWAACPSHTLDPVARAIGEMNRAADFYTESKIDLAWLMPMPKALPAFLAELFRMDPCLADHSGLFPDLWTEAAVVTFELESRSSKHAGGGLLNLSAYGVLGVAVTPDATVAGAVQETLRTYQPTLGLRNVHVRIVDL